MARKTVWNASKGTFEYVDDEPEKKVEEGHRSVSVGVPGMSADSDPVRMDFSNKPKPQERMMLMKKIPKEGEKDVIFKTSSLRTIQFSDKNTGTVLAYISGYGLDINFNMSELKSVEKIEELLEGMKSVFRNIITNKAINPG